MRLASRRPRGPARVRASWRAACLALLLCCPGMLLPALALAAAEAVNAVQANFTWRF